MNRVSLNKRSDLSRPLTWAEMDSNWQKIADYLYSIGVSADNAESTANKALAIAGGSPFAGIATPDGTPSVSSGVKSTYIAVQSGTYTNYGNLSVSSNEIAVLYYDGSEWSKTSMEVDLSEYIRTEADSETVPQPDVVTVDRAVSDGLGNNIPNTYATKTELVFPYVLDFSLLNKLNQDSTEENIYSALGGSGEFSHENLSELLNKIASYSFIIAKDSLSNVPIAFTYSSEEYVLQFEYYENYNSIKIYQSSGVFKVKIGSFNAFQFTVLAQSIGEVNAKTSEVYENLDVIKGSGETNPSKIYIDLETKKSYIYVKDEFVPLEGGDVVQDQNNIPFYTCRYEDEFAVPINEDDLTDVIVFRKRYGTNVERIKNGKSVWKIASDIIYLAKHQNYKLNQTLFVVDGYLYFRSRPYGVYKFSLEDGTFINNRTDINTCDAICYLNGNIYAVGDTNKLVVLNKDDLSLVSSTELDAKLMNPYLNSYEDRCIILLDKKAVVVKQDGETQEFIFDASPSCGFYIPETTYIKAPFYVFFVNKQIHTISEDLQYNFKSNISGGAIDTSLIGQISDLTQYITYGGWQSICFIGVRGCYICRIPGNNPITSTLFTALNINSNIDKDSTIVWYDCFYKTKSDKYIIKKGGVMYKVYSLL